MFVTMSGIEDGSSETAGSDSESMMIANEIVLGMVGDKVGLEYFKDCYSALTISDGYKFICGKYPEADGRLTPSVKLLVTDMFGALCDLCDEARMRYLNAMGDSLEEHKKRIQMLKDMGLLK